MAKHSTPGHESIRFTPAGYDPATPIELEGRNGVAGDSQWRYPRESAWGAWGSVLWGPKISGPYDTPAQKMSGLQFSGASPCLIGTPPKIPGPPVGANAESGSLFYFDTWGCVEAGLITSANVVVAGGIGTGKTVSTESIAHAILGWNPRRRFIIPSSPKAGEWTPLAKQVGGTIVTLSLNKPWVNPLNFGAFKRGDNVESWLKTQHALRLAVLTSIVSILRAGEISQNSTGDGAMLNQALDDVEKTHPELPPTIFEIAGRIADNPDTIRRLGVDEIVRHNLLLALLRVTEIRGMGRGEFAGLIDLNDGVSADPASPVIVADTSALREAGILVRRLAGASMSAWASSLTAGGDGYWRNIIHEEAMNEFADTSMVSAADEQMRMTSANQTCNWFFFHEANDRNQIGEAGSSLRETAKGLISKSTILILFKQSTEAKKDAQDLFALTDMEAELLTTLAPGRALWKIGAYSFLVQVTPTRSELKAYSTSAGRRG